MLVVDRHTLLAVHPLHLVDEVLLGGTRAEDAKDLLGVDRALDELVTHVDVVTVGDEQARTLAHRVRVLLGAVVRREQDATRLVGVLDLDAAGGLGDRGDTLGVRASKSSTTRGRPWVMSSAAAAPPVWKVRIVSCVPGSPIDWAAMMPTASPMSTSLPVASERP